MNTAQLKTGHKLDMPFQMVQGDKGATERISIKRLNQLRHVEKRKE